LLVSSQEWCGNEDFARWGLDVSLDAVKLVASWDRNLITLVLFLCSVPGRPFCFCSGLRLEKRQLAIVSHE